MFFFSPQLLAARDRFVGRGSAGHFSDGSAPISDLSLNLATELGRVRVIMLLMLTS